MLNLPFLFPFNFLFLSFSFLLIIFSNFLCYFFATENSKQPKITYLQHVSFTFIFFPFDVSFCFFSCFLFSFSFFSLVISTLCAFLFSPRVLYSLRLNLTLPPPRHVSLLPLFRRSGGRSPRIRYYSRSKVQRGKIGIFLRFCGPLM